MTTPMVPNRHHSNQSGTVRLRWTKREFANFRDSFRIAQNVSTPMGADRPLADEFESEYLLPAGFTLEQHEGEWAIFDADDQRCRLYSNFTRDPCLETGHRHCIKLVPPCGACGEQPGEYEPSFSDVPLCEECLPFAADDAEDLAACLRAEEIERAAVCCEGCGNQEDHCTCTGAEP
jgi:hypothetical protein